MLIYLALPVVILYFLFLQRMFVGLNYQPAKNIETYVNNKRSYLIVFFVLLVSLAVMRGYTVGTDYNMYYRFYLYGLHDNVEIGIQYIYELAQRFDTFIVFSIVCYSLVVYLFLKGIRKHCPNNLIGVLFFVLTYIYLTGFNQIRQIIVASAIFCFINLVIEKKKFNKLKFFILILIASFFHTSALVMLAALFIPKKKTYNSLFVLFLFLCTTVFYFVPELKNLVGGLLNSFSGFYADKYASNAGYFFQVNKEKGLLEFIPVLVQMVLVLWILRAVKDISMLKINEKLFHFSTNMVIIFLTLYSLSGIEAVDRLQNYFSVFNIYYYSIVVHILLNNKRYVYSIIIIVFWFLYYILRLYTNNSGVVPYIFNFQ